MAGFDSRSAIRIWSLSLLFNIYLNDLFSLAKSTKVCNFVDNKAFYACDKDLSSFINRLEHDSYLAIE